MTCGKKCEVYSRIVGYFRPISNWNVGKKQEFADRQEYDTVKAIENSFEENTISPVCDEPKDSVVEAK